MKKLFIILGVILFATAGIFYAALLGRKDSYSEVANKFMFYVSSGNSVASYSLLSDKKKDTYSPDEWEKYVKEVADKFPADCDKTTQLQSGEDNKDSRGNNGSLKYACDFMLVGNNYRIIFMFTTEDSKIVIDELEGYALP